MITKEKSACLVKIGDGAALIINGLFNLLSDKMTAEQQIAITDSIKEFAEVEKKLVHNLRKAFEN